jgi:hypothetical protein
MHCIYASKIQENFVILIKTCLNGWNFTNVYKIEVDHQVERDKLEYNLC